MKAPLYSQKGKKIEDVELNPLVYGVRVNERLLELVKNGYAANLRHGTSSTKTRKEVRGGGKKPWKQKGTGRARASSIRSPLWRGGGTVFGPKPRDYFVALPTSMRRSALIAALSQKAQKETLLLVEALKLAQPKTREFAEFVEALPLGRKKALYVVKELSAELKRASQNMSALVEVRCAADVNAFHILQKERLMIERDAMSVIEARLAATKKKKAGGKQTESKEAGL